MSKKPKLTLIQGGKTDETEERCYCDDWDVYDGYAECPKHPMEEK